MTEAELKARYGASEHGNFRVVGTIGVPHPYVIGAKHVAFAADHHGGMLTQAAIEGAERNGIVCEGCKGKLSFAEHKQALMVECLIDMACEPSEGNPDRHIVPELHAYLLKSKPLCEADKFEGFAFVDGRKGG